MPLPNVGMHSRMKKFQSGPKRSGTLPQHGQTAPLSQRERQVLELVAHGHTNKQIATQLHLSVKSVETYRARVMEKLNLRSRVELVRYALERGLLSRGEWPEKT